VPDPLLAFIHREIAIVWAEPANVGKRVTWAKARLDIAIKTVRRTPRASPSSLAVGGGAPMVVELEGPPFLPRLRKLSEMSESLNARC
jgi:hypothetical protein